MVKIILLIATLFPTLGIAKDVCGKNPIYCQIVKNKKSIDRAYAMHLSNIISRVSKQYKIPANVYTAMLMQESAYRIGAKNCRTGFEKRSGKLTTVCFDFGMSQINIRTIRALGFSTQLLTSDLEYSIEAGAIVLSRLRRSFNKYESDYWTRYNAVTPSKREVYLKLVQRYL